VRVGVRVRVRVRVRVGVGVGVGVRVRVRVVDDHQAVGGGGDDEGVVLRAEEYRADLGASRMPALHPHDLLRVRATR
jgi:hypothetical protein